MMAKATEDENLLSYFQFKEDLEKKLKETKPKKEKEFQEWKDWREPQKKTKDVDTELAKMIDGKEKENKDLEKKHKKELVEEMEGDEI